MGPNFPRGHSLQRNPGRSSFEGLAEIVGEGSAAVMARGPTWIWMVVNPLARPADRAYSEKMKVSFIYAAARAIGSPVAAA
jgi:hypothetical protein